MRIIYFDLDTLRADHLGCYGYHRPTSPHIDRIAAEGMRFDRYYCSNSPCMPSRTALVTGRFGIRSGVGGHGQEGTGHELRMHTRVYGGPQPENEMLPRLLRQHGYETISFSTFADRHSAFYFMCGWSEFHTPNLKGGMDSAEEVNEKLLPWLRQNAREENYFLHINYWDAHHPYKHDWSWAKRFADIPVRQDWPDEEMIQRHRTYATGESGFGASSILNRGEYPLMPESIASRADFEHLINGYDAEIAYVDHHVGVVLEELDRQGVLGDAVIIISADHGETFGEHGIYASHLCASEYVHRVPMLVRWPDVADGGSVCDELLYNVDLAPTLCELLGTESVPREWDGESFAACLRGDMGPARDYLVWDHGLTVVQRAVRTCTHLMIKTFDDGGRDGFEPVELYDCEADPHQTRNLRYEEPQILLQCEDFYNEWLDEQRSKTYYGPDPLAEIVNARMEAGS